MPPSSPQRYAALDSWRFLAASGVVLFHYNMDFHLGLSNVLPVVQNLSSMVDFFFILSGFVIMQGYRSRLDSMAGYRSFLVARLARIYPLHLLTLLAFLALAGVAFALHIKANHPENLALSGLPATLLLIQAWGVLDHDTFNSLSWSISAEWFVYLLAPLIFAIVRRVSLSCAVLAALLLIAFMIAVRSALGAQDWMHSTWQFGMLRALPSFFAGAALAEAVCTGGLKGKPSWWSVHAIALCALAILSLDTPREFSLPVLGLLIVHTALADAGGAPTMLKSPALLALGEASYALYMIHMLVSLPLLALARATHLIDTPWAYAFALFGFALSVALSLASYRYFEKPARDWIMRKAKSASLIQSGAAQPAATLSRG